jgi:formylglycine-generating enzyme required for sulfatase activity
MKRNTMKSSMTRMIAVLAIAMVFVAATTASAVDIETVPVGNPGNAGELSGSGAGGYGPDRICGAVDYEYNIGKYEVTAGQYTEFLNAVAATDTYGLYTTSMDTSSWGCKIQRSGSSGSYSYSVAGDWANRPVNYVSWGDAARFANWLHNGQPTGAQDLSTTEDGAYFLNGATSDAALLAVSREADWTWAITSEDEWYKAAYHKNDGVTGNYFEYPTSSDSTPSNDLISPDPGNNATYYPSGGDYTIGSPYYRTEVGEFENSESPYDTFDQGGNVWEWNESILDGQSRGLRGGSFDSIGVTLHASSRDYSRPAVEVDSIGFRVSEVPEPATMGLLSIGGLALLRRRRNRKAA